MAYLATKDAISMLAKRAGISDEEATRFCQAQAELAFELLDRGFPIPGIGVLVIHESPGKELTMRFGPQAGKAVAIPSRKQIKLRVSKLAMDVAFRGLQPVPDVTTMEVVQADDKADS